MKHKTANELCCECYYPNGVMPLGVFLLGGDNHSGAARFEGGVMKEIDKDPGSETTYRITAHVFGDNFISDPITLNGVREFRFNLDKANSITLPVDSVSVIFPKQVLQNCIFIIQEVIEETNTK